MKKEDKKIVVSFLLLLLLIFIGPEFTGYAVTETEEAGFVAYTTKAILPRFLEIVSTPFTYPKALWLVVPLIVILFFIEIYFGRWRNERLGWSSAFTNWITLLFVGMQLLRELFTKYGGLEFVPIEVVYKFLLVSLIFLVSISFMIILFLHAVPKTVSFLVSSPLTIYTFAFIMIALIYSDIPLDLQTLIASFLIYLMIIIIFKLIKFSVPPSKQARKYLVEKGKEKKRAETSAKISKSRRRAEFKKRLHKKIGLIKSKFMGEPEKTE